VLDGCAALLELGSLLWVSAMPGSACSNQCAVQRAGGGGGGGAIQQCAGAAWGAQMQAERAADDTADHPGSAAVISVVLAHCR